MYWIHDSPGDWCPARLFGVVHWTSRHQNSRISVKIPFLSLDDVCFNILRNIDSPSPGGNHHVLLATSTIFINHFNRYQLVHTGGAFYRNRWLVIAHSKHGKVSIQGIRSKLHGQPQAVEAWLRCQRSPGLFIIFSSFLHGPSKTTAKTAWRKTDLGPPNLLLFSE